MNKFNAVRKEVDGIIFDSQAEARRYGELKLLERAGQITNLEVHKPIPVSINGVKVFVMVLDFVYQEGGKMVFEDVKSPPTMTPVYRLKKRCVQAAYGIEIRETMAR